MSKHVFFVRECPTCGRRLHILVDYLGKKVVCPHCGARLDALDQAAGDLPVTESVQPSLMQRVDELLETSYESSPNGSRLPHPR
ncbi:MAG: hypothetical protein JW888_10145 [Pirellulales bacterium]|nr:hypothetical protein [Pirellulales bacterium]